MMGICVCGGGGGDYIVHVPVSVAKERGCI